MSLSLATAATILFLLAMQILIFIPLLHSNRRVVARFSPIRYAEGIVNSYVSLKPIYVRRPVVRLIMIELSLSILWRIRLPDSIKQSPGRYQL